jgi:hypothetical protein
MAVRRCLRDLPASSFSHADNLSANASTLLDRSGTLEAGSTTSARKYLRIVLRDKTVLRAISRIERWSRSAQRRITLSNSMLITPANQLFIIAEKRDQNVANGMFRLMPISKPWGWPDVITVFL